MKRMRWRRIGKTAAAVCCLLALAACTAVRQPVSEPSAVLSPAATQSDALRGVWLSYLELDGALRGAGREAAEGYIDNVMQHCADSGLNTVFFHVRAHGDAYYPSKVFPAADSAAALLADGFDPLKTAIDAAHRRGLSLHAWINPYRVGENRERAVCDDVFELDGCWYYIPSSATVQRHILDGVRELVDGYAVDGVQYDDYFYPAAMPAAAQPFESVPGTLSVTEYRMAAVSALVAATCSAVHRRAGCLFGVSPAGNLSRNTDRLYADVKRWLSVTGYVDYMCPQLYSGFENSTLPFESEAEEWTALPRTAGVRLYAGLALYKTGEADKFAGAGGGEWQNGGDILMRQAKYAAGKGYDGFSLFRYAHWSAPEGTVRAREISALIDYISQ